jgi:hypothetical protein
LLITVDNALTRGQELLKTACTDRKQAGNVYSASDAENIDEGRRLLLTRLFVEASEGQFKLTTEKILAD